MYMLLIQKLYCPEFKFLHNPAVTDNRFVLFNNYYRVQISHIYVKNFTRTDIFIFICRLLLADCQAF